MGQVMWSPPGNSGKVFRMFTVHDEHGGKGDDLLPAGTEDYVHITSSSKNNEENKAAAVLQIQAP
ncbi:hypothetical protein U0070_027039 [Myodes glareolus]|uniref:Uncharacterized protein n=1 Tax=Myodes glareolus TaxID=447135 RepID=A0AAW0IJV2_MYOGA